LVAVTLLAILALVSLHRHIQLDVVQVAAAKGKSLYDMMFMADRPLEKGMLPDLVLEDEPTAEMLGDSEYSFVSAVRLGYGEARQWRELGCQRENCAHVTYYDYDRGGTANLIVRLDDNRVLSRWRDADARPGGSADILPRAMAIAAADPAVRALLGDLSEPDPAMIPMSGWLADDACSREWCVDLTYHDPEGSGRILHIFVNLESGQVARTFLTRVRAERSKAEPIAQRNAYQDDCTEQYGWSVCWEMTAHDGVNFTDARYNGQLIFSSVKIGQVEAWYPSWPGGYRDEIGFAASVPPLGGTNVNDLGDGFAVSQLFTEFTYWPNCICCYRYEQILRFDMDGTMEFEFISHGPGCDDIPSYRPFWRIDLDLDGPEEDEVWIWETDQWNRLQSEREIHPFVEDLSVTGDKLATIDGALNYRWQMIRTDPFGRDESHFFVLRQDPTQGDGPIIAGPGDTYIPPRQWLGDEDLVGENIVLWFVPILKQLKGGPWWCMPDPDPEFSPCNTILRAAPGGPLEEPTAEELEQLQLTPTTSPTAETTAKPVTATPTEVPQIGGTPQAPPPEPTPTSRPRRLAGEEDPVALIMGSGCGSCHAMGDLGEARKVGPDLTGIGLVAADRIPGMSAEEYLRASIVDPNAFIVPNCPNGPCMPNIMPRDYRGFLSPDQVEILVAYLMEQTEEFPTIVGAGINPFNATPLPKAFPAPKRARSGAPSSDSSLAIQLLLVSILFLLTLFLLLRRPEESDA
jgi:hypothetical protein